MLFLLCVAFIVLTDGRNKLISNYLKGVIAFVDDYWKMIHRAAGWDALRYWCWVSTSLLSCVQFMVDRFFYLTILVTVGQ